MIVTSQIAASNEKMYHDAYTLQRVEADNLQNFNFVSGMVPFLLNLILDVSAQCFYVFVVMVARYIIRYIVPYRYAVFSLHQAISQKKTMSLGLYLSRQNFRTDRVYI